MIIVNAMFAKGLGGIEQSFVDYTKALLLQGHQVLCLINVEAKIRAELDKISDSKLTIEEVSNRNKWDFSAKKKIREIVKSKTHDPDFFIAHGNRAISLVRGKHSKGKLIGVAHNYKVKQLLKCDYIFSITHHLKQFLIKRRFAYNKIFITPNMIEVNEKAQIKKPDEPIVIGSMGRFVKKKGFDVFLKAVFTAQTSNDNFKVIIGGSGEELDSLQKLRDELKLEDKVDFIGWVESKEEFFEKIDIFCLPSLHEPFGIVVLEAMNHKTPIITSDSEGPSEILTDGEDALIVEKDHPAKMAMAILEMIESEGMREKFSENAYKKLEENYSLEVVSQLINNNLNVIHDGK